MSSNTATTNFTMTCVDLDVTHMPTKISVHARAQQQLVKLLRNRSEELKSPKNVYDDDVFELVVTMTSRVVWMPIR